MLPRYSVSPRLARRQSRNGVLRHRRNTSRRPTPRWRAFNRRTYPAIRGLKKRWSLALVSKFTPKIQSQCSEALIERRDFSGASPILLPEMAVHLDKLSQANDYASINELLATVNSLLMKTFTFKTNDLLPLHFKYCVDYFAKQLLKVFKRTAKLIHEVVANDAPPILKLFIESQRLCCYIFRSLNFQELPEFFKELMVEFKKYLTVVEDSSVDGCVFDDELRATICVNIYLYVIKKEGFLLFQGYLCGFVEDVLSLLVSSSSQHGSRHGRDRMKVAAITFLIIVSKRGHHALFSRDDILQQICESIVIPNLMLQDDEAIDMDPIEFIKRDMERGDMNSRRVVAWELLNEIGKHYMDKISKIVEDRVDIYCSLFAFDAEDKWKYKDYAIRLLVALAGEKCVQGNLADVDIVFHLLVARELGKLDVASFPIMKGGALKFLTLFRNQILKHSVLPLLPDLSRLVASPDQVVFSYAAICIEKLLLVQDDGAITSYTSKDICPILPTLMSILFHVFDYCEYEEDEYVMNCIMRVIRVGDLSPDVASLCIEGLTAILHKVCENPEDSLFIQYIFQSLTGLISRVCALSQRHRRKERPLKNAISLVSLLENKLYPILQMILARDITEFFRYAFEMLAELVELKRYPLPECYSEVFDILVLPDAWARSAKVPENTFLQKHEVSVLTVFDKLVTSLATDDQGYYVLNTVIEHLGYEVISPFVSRVWVSLFNRLQYKSTVKHVKNIIVLISRFLVKDGPKNFVSSVNSFHSLAFQSMLEEFWIPNLKLIRGPFELKLASVASTRVICESVDNIPDIRLWGEMLDNIMNLLSRVDDDEPEIPESRGEDVSYNAATTLASSPYDTGKKEDEEPLKDPRKFLVASLSKLLDASAQGKRYHQAINENLEQANQAALHQLFDRYRNLCL